MSVSKFTVYVCNNGYLLNVYEDGRSRSYVHDNLLKVLAHMADLGGVFDEDEEGFGTEKVPSDKLQGGS